MASGFRNTHAATSGQVQENCVYATARERGNARHFFPSADASSSALVESILATGRALGLQVVAEVVETAAQLKALQVHGCQRFQGYLFCEPMDAHSFEDSFLS
ncbi:MAG: EAL domain-containing protein [Halieaceae bacterium]|nr:EAL domain-containing protein [Halieaceae bacterium]